MACQRRNLRDIRYRLNAFAERFNGQTVATITSKEIDDWLRSLPFSPFARNRYRGLTVLAFTRVTFDPEPCRKDQGKKITSKHESAA